MKKIRVLYVESGSGLGGSAQSLRCLTAALAPTSVEPVIAVYAEDAERLFRECGTAPVYRLRSRGFFGRVWEMIRLMSKEKIDLLHTNNDLYSHFPVIAAGRWKRRPVVAHIRAIRSMTRTERAVISSVRHFIAVSDAVKAWCVSEGVAPDRIARVYNSVDLMEYPPRERRGGEPVCVGYVGPLRVEKGIDLFLGMVHLLKAEFPSVKFAATGSRPEDESWINACRQAGIFVMPHQSRVAPVYAEMDLVIYPTRLPEGFGRVPLEAAASGIPVVASRQGAVPEIVENGVTGILVDDLRPEAFAQAAKPLLLSKAARDDMGERARRRAAALFSLEDTVRGTSAVYDRVMQEN